MELKLDTDKFDALQEIFIREIIEQIRFKLAAAGISGNELLEITGEVAFSVASSIDDNAAIGSDGVSVRPYLAFVDEDDNLVHCGENAYSHELVAGIIGELSKTSA
jgi:hypothetical protein